MMTANSALALAWPAVSLLAFVAIGIMTRALIMQRREISELLRKSGADQVENRMRDWRSTAALLEEISIQLENTSEHTAIARLRLLRRLSEAWVSAQQYVKALDCHKTLLKTSCKHLTAHELAEYRDEILNIARWGFENYLFRSQAASESPAKAREFVLEVRALLDKISEPDPLFALVELANDLLKKLAPEPRK